MFARKDRGVFLIYTPLFGDDIFFLLSSFADLNEAEAVVIVDGLRGGVRAVDPVEGERLGREVGLGGVGDAAGQGAGVHCDHALQIQ